MNIKWALAIHPRFNKLITALRTAIEDGTGSLNKEATSYDVLVDADAKIPFEYRSELAALNPSSIN
jgi:hypothetical protein